jgi:hypothetical protein
MHAGVTLSLFSRSASSLLSESMAVTSGENLLLINISLTCLQNKSYKQRANDASADVFSALFFNIALRLAVILRCALP